jgi:hypothetical protein
MMSYLQLTGTLRDWRWPVLLRGNLTPLPTINKQTKMVLAEVRHYGEMQ